MKAEDINQQVITSEEVSTKRIQIIVFRLGNEEYALEIDLVKEVVPTPNITRVPLLPNYILGVANIRGKILAVLDLATKFGIGNTIEELNKDASFSLVIESEVHQMAVLAHQIPDTLSINESDIDDSPNIIKEFEKKYIRGVIKFGERLIILLDILSVVAEDVPQITKNMDG